MGSQEIFRILFPNLQGPAGDYVFNGLSSEEHSNYKVLIKCLKHRFINVKSAKIYAAILWKRDQKVSETEEAYTTELQYTSGKAYP